MAYYDLITMGNTLVDLTAEVDDDFLIRHNLNKGDWLHPKKDIPSIERDIAGFVRTAGGSAANVAAGCVDLGGKVLFYGSIGDDKESKFYKNEMNRCGVDTALFNRAGRTGKCISLITPDKERTFAVSMGVSSSLQAYEVPERMFENASLFHATSFALDTMADALMHSLEVAGRNGCHISFDLGSRESIKKHRSDISRILSCYADVAFANEGEAEEFIGEKKPDSAAIAIALDFPCAAVVKAGKEGAFVARYDDDPLGIRKITAIGIPAFPAEIVNTNGAGDAFAAGFCFVYSRRRDAFAAAYLGSYYASRVVGVRGARLK